MRVSVPARPLPPQPPALTLPSLIDPARPVSPNGIMFVKPTLRKSLLAKMLGELLDTRVMIKQAMKGWKSDKVRLRACAVRRAANLSSFPSAPRPVQNLSRTLNSRQLALKLLAVRLRTLASHRFSPETDTLPGAVLPQERHVRLHVGQLLGPHAAHPDGGRDRPVRARVAREGADPLLRWLGYVRGERAC